MAEENSNTNTQNIRPCPSSIAKPNIDSLLEDLGGCRLFQFLIIFCVDSAAIITAWTMAIMAYGNFNPGWKCANPQLDDAKFLSNTSSTAPTPNGEDVLGEGTWRTSSCDNFTNCDVVIFNKDSSTIVSEWNLTCDRFYITSSIISIQMAGVLFGTLLGGTSCNWIGRKPTHFAALAVHATLHLAVVFSVNWQMFAALRFFIGISCGVLLITTVVYPLEFVPRKWRSTAAAVPYWTIGLVLFSATAMILRDWRHLHIATIVLTVIFLLPVFILPESLRWLAVKGKTEEAHRVGMHLAKLHKRQAPNMEVFDLIANEEKRNEEENPRISILYLYRRQFLQRTLTTSGMWLCFSIVYYTILFGVKSLSGDFYINLMLTSSITTIGYFIAPVLANVLGRKWGCLCFLSIAFVGCILLVCFQFWKNANSGLVTLILTLSVVVFIEGSWITANVFLVELFPTPLRSLGLSHASCVSRVGGMVAPFLIPKDDSQLYIAHIVMAVIIVLTCIAVLFLPETKDKEMEDSIKREKHVESDVYVSP